MQDVRRVLCPTRVAAVVPSCQDLWVFHNLNTAF
jgi:hypothetical protein